MTLTPINAAEAIVEPFWDPLLSGLAKWAVVPGDSYGLAVSQGWCFASFAWARKPASGPALAMERAFGLDVEDYDRLVVSINAPEGSIVTILARTDAGERRVSFPPAVNVKRELALDLAGARKIVALRLEIVSHRDTPEMGWLNWVGLQNRALLARYERQWRRFDAVWEGFLLPPETPLTYRPARGLLLEARDIEELRSTPEGQRLVETARSRAHQADPESLVNDVIQSHARDTRYNREREHGKTVLSSGLSFAVAGIVAQDAGLLRLAARYAMAMLMSGTWEWGMVAAFPGSSFEVRSFVQSAVVEELVLIHDLAGELFTKAARELLLRRVAQEGVGNANFIAWKHEYIHHCNQLAAFSPGRLLGYALLEGSWPRVRPYLELAFQDLTASLDDVVLSDGGFVEGPSYFHYTVSTGARAIHTYARLRGRSLRDCTPRSLARSGAFAEAVYSTDSGQDHIPICDARARASLDSLAFLAASMPDSAWVAMYHRARERGKDAEPSIFAWVAGRGVPERGRPPACFTYLREMRLASSLRTFRGREVKIAVLGNKGGAGHTHEDKGSFILEYGGFTFAMDPGSCDYSHPLALLLKYCERHNMLVPVGLPDRPHPSNPLVQDVEVDATGDERSFRAAMDLEAGWEGTYRRWHREIRSDTPDRFVVTDTYELARGTGVELYWNTSLPVVVGGGVARIGGAGLSLELSIPAGASCRVDELPLLAEAGEPEAPVQRRIAFRLERASGTLEVEGRFVEP